MSLLYWTQKQQIGPPVRSGHAMAYDSKRGRTVLFGGKVNAGFSGHANFGDTWEWDGENWTQMADSGPAARYQHSMAFDSQRNQTVLFGGAVAAGRARGPGVQDDTWAWDGENWTQLADSGPPGRYLHGLAYDSARGVTVLFGGYGASSLLADTWEWDGTSWTQKAIAGPSARASVPLAFDSTRGRTVLFGGSGDWDGGENGTALGDTWEWDGNAWAEIANFGAPASMFATLAFKGDSVALLDGVDTVKLLVATTILAKTWSWDGQHWTIRQHFSPSPRWQHAMSYDSKRNCLVLFGGLAISNGLERGAELGDTWEHSETP
jgi:hypothetical protein